uniref:ranBP-type and C3HC4-type zinc finger-containing protein 1 isoform X1 n=2 Tax=Oncorhynchus gorbuscha TaxID=8017 RepID=UPI001EAF1871|nr:ranBP-type and C3HC4-type zinc finger-containing protein 1 isoform X1 [Oncorhynchus gorbuscha]
MGPTMTSPEVFTSNLEEAEELAQLLSEAISCGDKEEAKRCSEQLAELCVPVSVMISRKAYSQDSIRLKVGVGDAQSENYIPVTLLVTLDMTISDLKEKINTDYGFHPSLQSWVIGKRLARDSKTLYSHGVRKNGDQAYLYIKSAQAANLSREQVNQEEEHRRLDSIIESLSPLLARGATGPTPPPKTKQPAPPPLQPKPPVGWSCSVCTYANKPTRPGCEMCGSERPEDYKVPEVYQPDEQEIQRLQLEEMANLQYQQALDEERERNFLSLVETDAHSLVPNTEELDCPICLCSIPPGEGATLRECLHVFCRECLKGTIVNSMDPEVTCPYGDEDYSCDRKLQDREIQSLLSQEEHQKLLELRLSIAETRSENSYHCKTPDCAGWCIFEDEVNEFICELCKETNCLLCKAIHKDMNCKEYQDDLRIRAENDVAAKQTTQMLESLLQNGEAMHCPKCKVIVQKKDGCDWICCLMCKTEICWVTKQARWGPNGSGDNSGGCGCRFDGARCHPNCQNCH